MRRSFPRRSLLRLRPELRDRPCRRHGWRSLRSSRSVHSPKGAHSRLAHGMTTVEVETFPRSPYCPVRRQRRARNQRQSCSNAQVDSLRASKIRAKTALFSVSSTSQEPGDFFGSLRDVGAESAHPCQITRHNSSIAISRQFHTAISLARGYPATQRVTPWAGKRALSPLPLTVLDLPEKHSEIFSLWGIHTLGMLASLPEKELIARMGQEGKRLRHLARGELKHLLFQPVEPAFTLEEHMELDSPVELLDSLLFVVGVCSSNSFCGQQPAYLHLLQSPSHSRSKAARRTPVPSGLPCQQTTASCGSSSFTSTSKRILHRPQFSLSHYSRARQHQQSTARIVLPPTAGTNAARCHAGSYSRHRRRRMRRPRSPQRHTPARSIHA